MRVDQGEILERLKIYLKKKHESLPQQDKNPHFEEELQNFFEGFFPEQAGRIGYCNGLAALWLYFQHLQAQKTGDLAQEKQEN